MINAQRWQEVDSILEKIIELPHDDYKRYIVTHFENDSDMYEELLSFLHIRENPESLTSNSITFNQEMLSMVENNFDELSVSFIGSTLSCYQIDYLLGRGGTALVFSGHRNDGKFEQKVAIKILLTHLKSSHVKQRFIQEQKILAHLNHPNIVQLLDVGISDQNFPYLIMEQVEGRTIVEYCQDKNLTIKEILQLFLMVTTAIKYAHKHLVVHRDIKPSNILVSKNGQVKLLDFGIAKRLENENNKKDLTQSGLRPMTLRYASPEQITESAITTSTDVYQLGVLLYELLTDRMPYTPKNKSRTAIEDCILHQQVLKPSAVVKIQNQKNRQKLIKTIQGDLDTIVLKSLNKSESNRYSSAELLQKDIQNWLQGLPILAKKQTIPYKLLKLVKRNKTVVATLSLTFIVMIIMVSFYTFKLQIQRDKAIFEANKAKQVTHFLSTMFANANPEKSGKHDLKVSELLDSENQRLKQELSTNPQVLSDIEFVIAQSYDGLGEYDKALEAYKKVLTENTKLYGHKSNQTAKVYNQLSALFLKMDEMKLALKNAQFANTIAVNNDDLAFFAKTLNNLSNAQQELGHLQQAKKNLIQAVSIQKQITPLDKTSVFGSLKNLANIYRQENNFSQAIMLNNQALNYVDPNSYEQAILLSDLSSNFRNIGKQKQALDLISQVLTIKAKIYGEDHSSYAGSLIIKANILKDKGDLKEALEIYQNALLIYQQKFGETAPRNSIILNNMANIYFDKGAYQKAQDAYQQAINNVGEKLPEDHPMILGLKIGLAQSLLAQSKHQKVIKILEPAIVLLKNKSNEMYLAFAEFVLGQSYCAINKHKQGINLLNVSLTIAEKLNLQDLSAAEITKAQSVCLNK